MRNSEHLNCSLNFFCNGTLCAKDPQIAMIFINRIAEIIFELLHIKQNKLSLSLREKHFPPCWPASS